jgi:hypothetical protein
MHLANGCSGQRLVVKLGDQGPPVGPQLAADRLLQLALRHGVGACTVALMRLGMQQADDGRAHPGIHTLLMLACGPSEGAVIHIIAPARTRSSAAWKAGGSTLSSWMDCGQGPTHCCKHDASVKHDNNCYNSSNWELGTVHSIKT